MVDFCGSIRNSFTKPLLSSSFTMPLLSSSFTMPLSMKYSKPTLSGAAKIYSEDQIIDEDENEKEQDDREEDYIVIEDDSLRVHAVKRDEVV